MGACRWLLIVLALLYVAALGLWLVGTFGLFGQERDPLAGVFLVPLGWPWNRAVDMAPELQKSGLGRTDEGLAG